MKILALILSLYAMTLTAMPCADVESNTNSVAIEFSGLAQDHGDHVDTCSPFCFCVCCQTLSHTVSYNSNSIDFKVCALNIPTITQHEKEVDVSFWRPPKA